jgi:hypothetical protein
MAGFPVTKNAEAAFDSNYAKPLKEWLECQDFILAMIGIHMGSGDVVLKHLRHLVIAVGHSMVATAVANPKIRAFLPNVENPPIWDGELKWAADMQAQLREAAAMLQAVSLKEKREVMRYVKIIPTPVAAAYLGITEDMLNNMKARPPFLFGTQYAGGHCYSMEELNLIAQNLEWACDWIYEKVPPLPDDDSTVLDRVVMVDEYIATALTDTTVVELSKLLSTTEHTRRPFRLSDLEKIRVAKLNGQQH